MTSSRIAAEHQLRTALVDRLRQAGGIVYIKRADVIYRANEPAEHLYILTTGFVSAVKSTSDGVSQSVALYFPGDIVGYEIMSHGAASSDYVSLTASAAHKVPVSFVGDTIGNDADHARAFLQYVVSRSLLAQDWLLNVGRRQAYVRTAHFLCEFVYRSILLADDNTGSYPFPFTQMGLANTLGLSVVHVNRILVRLREAELIALKRGRIEVLDGPGLQKAAGFHHGYFVPSAA